MLDWLMASARAHFAEIQRDKGRVSAPPPVTTISSQPMVQDNESIDPYLSRDGKT